MSLPRVTTLTREKIARELDERGPESCLAEAVRELADHNPEILDIATKCARSFGDRYAKAMLELCVFFRLLFVEFRNMDPALRLLNPFPRLTAQTRDKLVQQIEEHGIEAFTARTIEHLALYNAELLEMAHNAAERKDGYVRLMHGFALLYRALEEQCAADASPIILH